MMPPGRLERRSVEDTDVLTFIGLTLCAARIKQITVQCLKGAATKMSPNATNPPVIVEAHLGEENSVMFTIKQ